METRQRRSAGNIAQTKRLENSIATTVLYIFAVHFTVIIVDVIG
jgi:hypothetical protein